jgi:2-methylcitrate dehydratase
MRIHRVRVHKSAETPPREQLLAWQLAAVAADPVPVDADVAEMIVNRLIDNMGVAVAGLARLPVANARAQAVAHPTARGATVVGLPRARLFSCEWAAWANGTAVRELDFHDTFLAADMNHPGDVVSPIVAVAQQCGRSGADLLRGIAAGYEVAVDLAKGMCLHKHRIDHILHIAAGAVAGIGAALRLPVPVLYQALGHAVHASVTTRQSRKGAISTWKAYAPAHAGKIAVEEVERAMRADTSPAPFYEGGDSIIAWLLDGPDAAYDIPLPEPGEPKRAILETYTKAYSAEIQSQSLIDLAFRMRERIGDLEGVADILIRTSYHTHQVIGSGAADPQKLDPEASRETLDHSLMYIFAVALEDGRWHHVDSYAPERARRPGTVALWHKIRTEEDPEWTRRYHSTDPREQAFGGRVIVTMRDGRVLEDEIAVADAHPLGRRPFRRPDYVEKFRSLSQGIADPAEIDRFLASALVLPDLRPGQLTDLTVEVPAERREPTQLLRGIFDLTDD